MAASKSVLSAGELIRSVLLSDAAVAAVTDNVFPVVSEDAAALPYIVYGRQSLDASPVKTGRPASAAQIQVSVYTAGYTEGVELAEAVRDALDFAQAGEGDFRMRSCLLTDSSEDWAADAYVQHLIFTVRI